MSALLLAIYATSCVLFTVLFADFASRRRTEENGLIALFCAVMLLGNMWALFDGLGVGR